MAGTKISALAAGTSLVTGDLLPFVDVSDLSMAPTGTTKKITYASLLTNLNADLDTLYNADGSLTSARTVTLTGTNTMRFAGGRTTFVGQDSAGANSSFRATDLATSVETIFFNDGVFRTGLVDLSNYLRHEADRTVQFSNTSSATGFIADRGGSHKVGLRSGSSLGLLQFTGKLAITSWTGAETGSGINNYYAEIDGSVWHFGQNAGAGLTTLVVNMQRRGSATSTATQTDSSPLRFTSGLWNGAAVSREFDIQSIANTGVNDESSLNVCYEGTDFLRLLNTGYLRQAAIDAAIADGDLNNSEMSFYIDETGNTLTVKVKYAGGTVKTGTVALT
jgi:hypothetical protein